MKQSLDLKNVDLAAQLAKQFQSAGLFAHIRSLTDYGPCA